MRILNLKALPLFLLLFAIVGAMSLTSANNLPLSNAAQRGDRVVATRTIRGTLKGFEVGDYVHAVITLQNGKEKSYYMHGGGIDYFLALHKGEPLVITYQIVDSYVPEAGGRQRIERISGARAGRETYAAWWRKVRAKNSISQLDKKYGKLVEDLRLNP